MAPGQRLPSVNDYLTSKNGRYRFRHLIANVSTTASENLKQLTFAIEDTQGKATKYYFLCNRPSNSYAQRLVLTASGDVEVIGEDDTTVVWTSADSAQRRDRQGIVERERKGEWERDRPVKFDTYELVLQDDGDIVLNAMVDKAADERDERRYRDVSSELRRRLLPREPTWHLRYVRSYPDLNFPGRSILRKGQALQRGEELSLPDRNTILRMQDDGNLVLYGRKSQAIWATNTIREDNSSRWGNGTDRRGKTWYDYNVEKLVMQEDGNLVYMREGERTEIDETVISRRSSMNPGTQWSKKTRKGPVKEVLWSSDTTSSSSSSEDKYLQLHPGKAVIYINGKPVWDTSKLTWKPGPPWNVDAKSLIPWDVDAQSLILWSTAKQGTTTTTYWE